MNIRVTSEDIEHGQMRDPYGCPVARAVRRAGVAHFGVTGMAVMAGEDRQRTMVILPSIAQDWIKAFDYGMPVAPFEFELLLPPELEEKLQKPRVERTRRVEPEPFFAPPRKNLVPAAEAKDEDELVLA